MLGWSNFKKVGSGYVLIFPAQFSLGQFYVANLHPMVELFLGQIVGKLSTFAKMKNTSLNVKSLFHI